MHQTFNPYLPLYEYIPDGEPHVFDGRVYIFGSHDRFDGGWFCLNDYVAYSADVKNPGDWRFEGFIYKAIQDPVNQTAPNADNPPSDDCGYGYNRNPYGMHQMWAPDVVKGADGRYYLYYCLDNLPEIAVAVCDTPAGQYEYLGRVRHSDGTPVGRKPGDYIQFDPGIFSDSDGTFYLYSGNSYRRPQRPGEQNKGSQVMRLENDMLTVKGEIKVLLPDMFASVGTSYEAHPFFEASSIRKINGKYYLVYSSCLSHELCYAMSDRPDEGYRFGGTLVDIGDCYLNGREEKDALNPLGNTHGGLENLNGQWYVFYHRQTNRTGYSRQACAEPVSILSDGSIPQVEVTSCGLNGGPLESKGLYPASVCCRLTAKEGAVMSGPEESDGRFPYIRQLFSDVNSNEEGRILPYPAQCVMNLKDGGTVGYKYFKGTFHGVLELALRGYGASEITVSAVDKATGQETVCGSVSFSGTIAKEESRVLCDGRAFGGAPGEPFEIFKGNVDIPFAEYALYFTFNGPAVQDFYTFAFKE